MHALIQKMPIASSLQRLSEKSPTLKMTGNIFVNIETFLTSVHCRSDVT